jgi:hypothetical protein
MRFTSGLAKCVVMCYVVPIGTLVVKMMCHGMSTWKAWGPTFPTRYLALFPIRTTWFVSPRWSHIHWNSYVILTRVFEGLYGHLGLSLSYFWLAHFIYLWVRGLFDHRIPYLCLGKPPKSYFSKMAENLNGKHALGRSLSLGG